MVIHNKLIICVFAHLKCLDCCAAREVLNPEPDLVAATPRVTRDPLRTNEESCRAIFELCCGAVAD